jgi:hypothetical protein
MIHVDKWDLTQYPDKENGKPGSDVFRLSFLDYEGMIQWSQKDIYDDNGKPTGETKNNQPRRWEVTGLGSRAAKNKKLRCVSSIAPEDLRMAEDKIGGLPALVQMALWYEPQFGPDGIKIIRWVALDRKKVLRPKYWRNVTEVYYSTWRPEAYKTEADPYQDMQRPRTRIEDLTKDADELKAVKAELEALKAGKK